MVLMSESCFPVCGVVVLVSQPCPTLCEPMDCKLPGSSVGGMLQARTLEWVAISWTIPNLRSLLLLMFKDNMLIGIVFPFKIDRLESI